MSGTNKILELMARVSRYAPFRLHRRLYQLTGGKLGATTPGGKLKVLLLTTTGHKSGLPRTHPVMHYQDGENLVIVASNAGADKPPLWYLNLKRCPEVTVQVGKSSHRCFAREASADERIRLWPILTDLHPVYKAYQMFTERQLPVLILRPIE